MKIINMKYINSIHKNYIFGKSKLENLTREYKYKEENWKYNQGWTNADRSVSSDSQDWVPVFGFSFRLPAEYVWVQVCLLFPFGSNQQRFSSGSI